MISDRGAIWEQILERSRTGADDKDNLFGDVTTIEQLEVIRSQLRNVIASAVSEISPEGTPRYEVYTPPSFKENDEGLFDMRFQVQDGKVEPVYLDGGDTHHHVETIRNLLNVKDEGLTNIVKRSVLEKRFAKLTPATRNSLAAAYPRVTFPEKVSLLWLSKYLGIDHPALTEK